MNDAQSYAYMPWASIDSIDRMIFCAMSPQVVSWAGIDTSEVYRNLPVSPACCPLQAYHDTHGRMIVDSRLQFGHRLAPEVAGRF